MRRDYGIDLPKVRQAIRFVSGPLGLDRPLARQEFKTDGIDLLVWVLPPLGVLAGIAVLVTSLRRMAPGALDAEVEPAASLNYEGLDPEYVGRVERELPEFSG